MAQPFPTPDGYVWTGTVYARIDPVPGDPANVLTPSQMAYSSGVANPEQYLPQQTPAAPPTPTYSMDENGNTGAGYTYSTDQAAAGHDMLNQQLLATGSNRYMPPPTVTQGGQTTTYSGPSNQPAPTPAPAPVIQTPNPATPWYNTATPAPAPGGAGGSAPFPAGSNPGGSGGSGTGGTGNIPGGMIQPSPVPPPAAGGAIGGVVGGGMGGVTVPPVAGALTRTQALQYIYNYPDLQTAWEASGMDPVQFANSHYSTHGQGEQRTYEPINNFSNALGLGAQSNYYPVGQNRVSPQLSGGNGEIAQQLHNRMQGQRQMSPTSAGLAALYGYGTTGAYSPQMPFYTPFTGYAEVDGPGKARYFDAYKDVRDAYYNDANVGRGNDKSNGYMDQYTPAQFAALHFNTHGEAEGRVSPYGNDGLFTTRFTPTVMQNFNKAPAKSALADKAEEIADDAAVTARTAAETNGLGGLDGGG